MHPSSNPPSSTNDYHPTNQSPSSLSINTLPRSSVSSGTKIPPMSPHTSISIPPPPSLKPSVRNNNKMVLTPSAPMGDPALERQLLSHPNKRKHDSETRDGLGSLDLREAQEKVEQKRARIAARVPSAMAGNPTPALAAVTTLVDLYAQLRRDSSATRQQDPLNVLPLKTTPKIVSRNGRHQPQTTHRGHSSCSSPDPIAMSENDQEIVIVKHVRPSDDPHHARAANAIRPEPSPQLGPPKRLKPLSRNDSTAKRTGIGKLSEKSLKSKPTFAVVIPSPPKRVTYEPARLGEYTPPRPDVPRSRSRDRALTGSPIAADDDTLGDITNGKALKHFDLRSHTPSLPATPAAPTRAVDPITETVPEPGLKRPRGALGLHGDASPDSLDIDVLGSIPLPFDFSMSHNPHPTRDMTSDNVDDNTDDESSLWWYHPVFEARAKADMRRTLRALLPADPAQDPPLPIGGGADGWRAEVRPRQSRARLWAERLEDAFGPGPLNRGLGRKPRRGVARPAGAARRAGSESSHSKRAGSRPVTVVIANSYPHTHGSIDPPSQLHRPLKDHDASHTESDADLVEVMVVDEEDASVGESKEAEAATAWTAALLPLVKGKTTMDGTKMALTNAALRDVERANEGGHLSLGVLKESALADTVRRLGELEEVPLDDVYELRRRARTLAESWRKTFGDEVVDLQRSVFLHAS